MSAACHWLRNRPAYAVTVQVICIHAWRLVAAAPKQHIADISMCVGTGECCQLLSLKVLSYHEKRHKTNSASYGMFSFRSSSIRNAQAAIATRIPIFGAEHLGLLGKCVCAVDRRAKVVTEGCVIVGRWEKCRWLL